MRATESDHSLEKSQRVVYKKRGLSHVSEVRLGRLLREAVPLRDACAKSQHHESNKIAGRGGHGPHSTRDESLKGGSSPFYFNPSTCVVQGLCIRQAAE